MIKEGKTISHIATLECGGGRDRERDSCRKGIPETEE